MTGIPHDALVVVTDSEKALFLINRTDSDDPHLEVISEKKEANPPDREQTENRRGRVQASHGSGVSAYEEMDFHESQKHRFATDLSERL